MKKFQRLLSQSFLFIRIFLTVSDEKLCNVPSSPVASLRQVTFILTRSRGLDLDV